MESVLCPVGSEPGFENSSPNPLLMTEERAL